MEPLHREVRKAILDASAEATEGDIDEYELLLSATFQRRPPDDAVELLPAAASPQEARIAELEAKLFPGRRR